MTQAFVGGKRWDVVFAKLPRGTYAECDGPTQKHKQMRFRPSLVRQPQLLVECIIHECIHAQGWHLDEDFVTNAARDTANLLKRFGLIVTEFKQEIRHDEKRAADGP